MLDKAGRIVLPKSLRDEMNLSAGDSLEVETHGAKLTLEPVRPLPDMQKERGVWVFRTGEKLTRDLVDQTVQQIRDARFRSALDPES